MPPHPDLLARTLRDAARGVFPPADGELVVVPPSRPGLEAVVCLTGRAYVETDLAEAELRRVGADAFGGATMPAVLQRLAGPQGQVGVLDVLLAACGTGAGAAGAVGRAPDDLREVDPRGPWAEHPRVAYSLCWRTEVRVLACDDGVLVLSRGVAGLHEAGFEVRPHGRGRGVGRALLRAALDLLPAGEPLLAAAAPGNAASLRAVTAAGFAPIGSVQLVRTGRDVGAAG